MTRLFNGATKGVSLAAATALATAVLVAPAAAADRYVLESVEETPVELGTGWYIRGDLGIAANGIRNTSLDRDVSDATDASYEGRQSDTDGSFTIGAAVGYRFAPNIRGDISADYIVRHDEGIRYDTTCLGASKTTVGDTVFFNQNAQVACYREDKSAHDIQLLQANAYYEFKPESAFSPFLGVGFGVARVQYDLADDRYTCQPLDGTDYTERCLFGDFGEQAVAIGVERSGSTYHLAGSLTAGLSYRMGKNLSLDTAYRYTRIHGDALFGGEDGRTDMDGDLHQVKFGLRYDIW